MRRHAKLGVESGEVVEDVDQFVFEIVGDERVFGMVAQSRVPGEVGAHLRWYGCQLLSILHAAHGGLDTTYINGKFPSHPDKLAGIGLELLDAALVGFSDIDGIAAEAIDNIQVVPEHIGMLVIFLRDVLLDRIGKGYMRRLSKGDGQEAVAVTAAVNRI